MELLLTTGNLWLSVLVVVRSLIFLSRGVLSNKPPVPGKSTVNLGCGSALHGKLGSNPPPKAKKSGPSQVHSHSHFISAPSTSTAQSSTIYSQPSHPLIPSHCYSVSLSQPLPLLQSDNQCLPSECSFSLPSSAQNIDKCISEHRWCVV